MNTPEGKENLETDHSNNVESESDTAATNQASDISKSTETPVVFDGLTASDIIPAEILNQLPPEAQRIISVQLTQMRGGLPHGPSPIAQKLSPEHITAIIQNGENESVRDFTLAKIGQNTRRIGMGAVIAVITIILIYAGVTKDKDLSEKIIFASISAIGGYGYGKSERRTD
jgi:hypothetical protein